MLPKKRQNATSNMTNSQEEKIQEQTQDQENLTMDELFAQQDQMQEKLNKREIVNVSVVQISQDYVMVDTGDNTAPLILVH